MLRLGAVLASWAVLIACASAETNAAETASYRIEFYGRDPPNDWAYVASELVDANLVPIKTVQLARANEGPCDAVLGALGMKELRLSCSSGIQELIAKLNKTVKPNAAIGTTVRYPDLPLEEIRWNLSFDRSLQPDRDRFAAVSDVWRQLQTGVLEKSKDFVQVELKGYRTKLSVPDTPENAAKLNSLGSFDKRIGRPELRVLRIDDEPIAKRPYSLDTPSGWFEQCRSNRNNATLPKPAYAKLLGLPDTPPCARACLGPNGDRSHCPEIILIDQQVQKHPDLAKALGVTAGARSGDDMCPYIEFDLRKHHGTHLAGLMVGDAVPESFAGLAPFAMLDNRNYESLTSADIVDLVQEKSAGEYNRLGVFVFASQFKIPGITGLLADPDKRRDTPSFVVDILNSDKLWIVAAGEEAAGHDVSPVSPESPMNLGDMANVLVVTACEDCFSAGAHLPVWANYSKERLVNLAAPGGTDGAKIPGPADDKSYTSAYGTSQATALVGGLAAAMLSCYPSDYVNPRVLKKRLLAGARPPIRTEMAQRLSTGVVEAMTALRDPQFHWITLVGEPPRKAKEIAWCDQYVYLSKPDRPEPLFDGIIQSKKIRQIYRYQNGSETPVWYFNREPDQQYAADIMPRGPARMSNDGPLLKVRYEDGKESKPLRLDDIEALSIGFVPTAINIVAKPGRCAS